MNVEDLLREKREEILRIAAAHGARNVRVFGSVVRGEADHRSDIDLLVTLDPGTTLFDHAALILELENLLGCKIDVASDRGLRSRVKERVMSEAVPL
jgi:predicted nucleotidyltransferase